MCPETSRNPEPRKNTTPGSSGGPNSGRRPGLGRRGRSGGCGLDRRGAGGSRCSERPRHYSSVTMSDAGGQRRTRAVPPICTAEPESADRLLPRPFAAPGSASPRSSSAKRAHPYQPSPGVLIASRVRSAWRQQWADGRVAGWSGNAGAAGTVTFTDVDFAVPKDNDR